MNALSSLISLISPFSSPQPTTVTTYTLPSILQIRHALSHLLPPELITLILDHAEIWLSTSTSRQDSIVVMAHPHLDNDAGMYYLVSDPLPRTMVVNGEKVRVKMRMVKWKMQSHDQGWGGEEEFKGTYQGSYTWFEACILKPPSSSYELPSRILPISDIDYTAFGGDSSYTTAGYEHPNPLPTTSPYNPRSPPIAARWHIQSNVQTSSAKQDHTVEWSWDDGYDSEYLVELEGKGQGSGEGFLGALEGVERYRDGIGGNEEGEGEDREGGRVGILARAMYPGWQNYVYSASIDVFYTF